MDNTLTLRQMVEVTISDYIKNRGHVGDRTWNDVKLKDLVLSDYDDKQLLSILELATIYFYQQRG